MSFFQRFPTWLREPDFQEEDTARVARLLYAISLTILGMLSIDSLVILFSFSEPGQALFSIAILWVILLIVLVLVRWRHVATASWFFIITFWLYFATNTYFLGGISSILFTQQIITVILAALLLGGRAALLVTAFTVLAGGGLAYVEVQGLLPPPLLTMTPLNSWLIYTGIYAVIGALLFFAVRGLQEALARARNNEQSLAEQNLILEEQRATVQASEARWRSLVDNAPALILNANTEGIITFVNRWGPQKAVGQSVETSINAPYIERVKQAMAQVLAKQTDVQYEVPYSPPDQPTTWHTVSVGPIWQEDHIVGLTFIAFDITERKQAEEAFRASEELMRSINESAPDNIMKVDLDGTIRFINRTVAGLTVEEVIDTSIFSYVPEHFHANIRACFDRVIKSGNPDLFEVEYLMEDDQVLSFEARVGAVFSEGTVIALTIVSTDVTERKNVEAERETLIKELEVRNTELERFTYTVSHDLKSPLITIKGFLGLLQRDTAEGDIERMNQDILHISSATDKMARLLGELLELSRIGRLMNPPEEIELAELASEAASLVAGPIEERGVVVKIEADMPVVFGDRVRLLEVYQNLIDNAVKFMGEQAVPHVEIGTKRLDEEDVCYVRDNGVGIEPEYHEKIFGLFERLKVDEEGTGIGLALVKRIVEVHGGRIWIESAGQGQGSTFYFTLPSMESPDPGA